MDAYGILQIILYVVLILLLVKPLGGYMARLFNGEVQWLTPIENLFYRLSGVKPQEEQHWTVYTISMLWFNLTGLLLLYGIQRLQGMLPLNPQKFPAVEPSLAFNTAVSFTTNTNWQSYVGESTMSYFTQMVGLSFHNFVSAATGIALAIALIRAFARHSMKTIGNFWVDLVRGTVGLLLPICMVYALLLTWQGVPQNFSAYTQVHTLEDATQSLAQGPIASQEAIKMMGTNGGGFVNANSSHPYENPTPLSNMLQMLSIFAIGASLTFTFGRMVGNERQGWAILAVMGILFLTGVAVVYAMEAAGNPAFTRLGLDTAANMEGKEVRFGIANSALFSVITTAASCGAVNGMHDSFTPLGGLIPLLNIQLGEIIVGGVGAGMYGMLLFAVLTVFIAGLMVGRTPEYLGKKIEAKEIKMTMLAILILPLSILGFTALSAVLPDGIKGPLNAGPHGFSEILYAFTSGTGNNGSAFAGLTANTFFYNLTIGLSMLIGRFLMIVPAMAVAGSLVSKKRVPASAGTFPTDSLLFILLLTGTILIVGGLTFFPALAVGPVVEHVLMRNGKVF